MVVVQWFGDVMYDVVTAAMVLGGRNAAVVTVLVAALDQLQPTAM